MSLGNVVFYDFEHCREFLEDHSRHLRDNCTGLEALGLYRELFHGFTHEALESSSITLGQFDTGLIYMFVPEPLRREYYPEGHKLAQKKAIELMGSTEPPIVFELLSAQDIDPPLPPRNRCSTWMRPELMILVDQGVIEIHLYFNGHAFFEQILVPSIQQQGFSVADSYLSSAKSGYIKTRHPNAPGKVFKMPWIQWIREMMAGGYSMAYMMALLGNYMIKMNQAVTASSAASKSAPPQP